MSNAFNSLDRKSILDVIRRKFPGLYKYVKWAYSSPTPLYDSSSKFICNSSTGVRQGDPLGSLLFAAGIHEVLTSVQNSSPRVTLFAYDDDITVICSITDIPQAIKSFERKFLEIGLKINRSKSQLYANEETLRLFQRPPCMYEMKQSSSYMTVLGCPVGRDAEVVHEVSSIIEDFTKILPLIVQLDVQSAFTILSYCINSKPIFLLRAIDPTLIKDSITHFDSLIDSCLSIITSKIKTTPSLITSIDEIESYEEKFPIRSKLVRKIPTNRGGLGLRAGADISKMAWLSSMLFSTQWLYQNLPYFLPQFLPTVVLPQSLQILNEVVTVSEKALIPFDIDPSPEQLREYFRSNKPTPRQKDLVKKMVDDVNMKSIIDHLSAPQFKTTLAWFHGQCDKNTGRWIRSTTTRNKALALSNTKAIDIVLVDKQIE